MSAVLVGGINLRKEVRNLDMHLYQRKKMVPDRWHEPVFLRFLWSHLSIGVIHQLNSH